MKKAFKSFWPKLIEENRSFYITILHFIMVENLLQKLPQCLLKGKREFMSKYNKVTHTIQNNINLINFFKAQNEQYVESINNNYQKILIKERKNGFITNNR